MPIVPGGAVLLAFTAEDIHDTALASLAGEFAEIVDTSHAIDRIGEA